MTRLWDKGAPLDERVLAYTAGEDHALDERLVRYDVQASIAFVSSFTACGPEQTVKHREIHSPSDHAILIFQAQQDSPQLIAANEVACSVNRIDDPAPTAACRSVRTLFAQ